MDNVVRLVRTDLVLELDQMGIILDDLVAFTAYV